MVNFQDFTVTVQRLDGSPPQELSYSAEPQQVSFNFPIHTREKVRQGKEDGHQHEYQACPQRVPGVGQGREPLCANS
jgi:hypothetical protein